MMFNATAILIDAFVQELQAGYRRTYGKYKPDYPEIIAWAGTMALENIANCDALYHNVEHTMLVALVGQEILRGKHIREGGVSPEDWLHYLISLLCHDIGYVKGVCISLVQPDLVGIAGKRDCSSSELEKLKFRPLAESGYRRVCRSGVDPVYGLAGRDTFLRRVDRSGFINPRLRVFHARKISADASVI